MPASQSTPYAGRNMNSSRTITRFAPGRSSLPWQQDFAVTTSTRVRTAPQARRTRGRETLGKRYGPKNGAVATQTAAPARPPTSAMATTVRGSCRSWRWLPARKYATAFGRPAEKIIPSKLGRTRRRA
jgi:hypothetical protein